MQGFLFHYKRPALLDRYSLLVQGRAHPRWSRLLASLLPWGFLQICYCRTQEIAAPGGQEHKHSLISLGDLKGNSLLFPQILITFQHTLKLYNKAASSN